MLTEQQLRLYGRQVIVRELGQAGQAQLCASRVAITDDATPVARVAGDYLRRAGLQVVDPDSETAPIALASSAQVQATAGEPALHACAEWLLGAWAAVETIKQSAGVGVQAASAPAPLNAEVD